MTPGFKQLLRINLQKIDLSESSDKTAEKEAGWRLIEISFKSMHYNFLFVPPGKITSSYFPVVVFSYLPRFPTLAY